MNKIVLWILFMFFLFVMLNTALASTIDDLGTFKQDECVDLYQLCDNCTYVNLSSITYPNSSLQYINEAMTQNGVEFNYSFCNTSVLGEYFYKVCGDKDGTFQCEIVPFSLTMTGYELTTSKSIIYGGLFVIFLFFFVFLIFIIGRLPKDNNSNEMGGLVSISLLKYLRATLLFVEWILLCAIFYLTSNLAFAYLGEELFAKTLFTLFQICFAFTLPILIIWLIWIIASIIKDKNLKRMMERGLFPSSQRRL